MAASPEFFQPAAYSPGLHLFATTEPAAVEDDDDLYRCRTPTGADLGNPATCPPAPRKPRPPPASACRKRLFASAAADIIALRFDDLEAIFRPASLSDAGKQQQRRPSKAKLTSTNSRRSVGKIFLG